MKNKINNVIKTTILFILIFMMIFGDGQIDGILNSSIDAHAEDTSAENAQNTQTDAQKPVPPTIEKIPEGGNGSATQSAQSSSTSVNTSGSTSPAVTSTNGTTEEKKTETADKTETGTTETATQTTTETAETTSAAKGSDTLQTLTTDVSGKYRITVKAAMSVLSGAVSISASELPDSKVQNFEENAGNNVPDNVEITAGFDITLLDGNNNKVEPSGDVTVTIENIIQDIAQDQGQAVTDDNITVFRADDSAEDIKKIEDVNVEGNDLEITTDHFTEYYIGTAKSAPSGAVTCSVSGSVTFQDSSWREFMRPKAATSGSFVKLKIKAGSDTDYTSVDPSDIVWTNVGKSEDNIWNYEIKNIHAEAGENITVAFDSVDTSYSLNNVKCEYSSTDVQTAIAPSANSATPVAAAGTITLTPVLMDIKAKQTVLPADASKTFVYNIAVSSTTDAYKNVSNASENGGFSEAFTVGGIPVGLNYKITVTPAAKYTLKSSSNDTGTVSSVAANNKTAEFKLYGHTDLTENVIWCDNDNAGRPTPVLSLEYSTDGGSTYTAVYESNMASLGLEAVPEPTVTTKSYSNQIYTYSDLPAVTEDGKSVKYKVSEASLTGYISTYSDDGKTIINQKTKTFKGSVKWSDADAAAARPDSVTIKLFKNTTNISGTAYKTLSVTPNDKSIATWSYSIPDLPAYDTDGKPIYYYAAEYTVDNNDPANTPGTYSTTYDNGTTQYANITNCCADSGTICNKFINTTTFSATKIWKDSASDVASRPAGYFTLWRITSKDKKIDGSYDFSKGAQVHSSETATAGFKTVTLDRTLPAGNSQTINGSDFIDAGNSLPLYDNSGTRYIYFVKEILTGSNKASYRQNYKASTAVDAAGTTYLLNGGALYNIPVRQVDVRVSKTWRAAAVQNELGKVNVTFILKRYTQANTSSTKVYDATFDAETNSSINTKATTNGFTKETLTQVLDFGYLDMYDSTGNQYYYEVCEKVNNGTSFAKGKNESEVFASGDTYTLNDKTYTFNSENYSAPTSFDASGNGISTIQTYNTLSGKIDYCLKKVWENNGYTQPANVYFWVAELQSELTVL